MKKLVLAHLSIWFGFFSLFLPILILIPSKFQIPEDFNMVFSVISLMITTVAAFYSSFFFTKKIIVKKPRNILFPIIFFILLIQSIFLLSFFELIGDKDLILVFVHVVLVILFVILGGVLQFQMAWNNKNNELRIELERQNHKSQMAILISQINPHFLFNTLHNIDTLIYDNQEKASKSLVSLADIMRYMLKDTMSDLVELQKEIEHLENYLSLEQLRLKNKMFINYSINGDYKGLKIAPMIMIPFIENAFKHSVDSIIENGVIIKIKIENHTLSFVCENQFDKLETDKDKVHGIGLETVKKRLDMIYINNYKLSINSNNSVFKVNLEIKLDEN